ncbi:D-2-hydroxyacid dehydrogenase [Legionella taurinensis]|uniref:D-2-hydroxyacid dehydrogenase n=1 Tax=Legionella taurinensis TaxID=70611 RepID=A0A3A5LED6_9GAMM|nr:D-2-hydroxyacid dehydrogenase [Legionella taurinensis]MDX1837752.1 D-2-hydroxyacid dehydrogenase [Legionella taurinensis]PUT40032.1 glycerate dehydrogenase [Legionella taurinensis]PUT43798.1 glycerate dehydrogenase [Legionella taurinensis]PUT46069.1 glycerate dehydrogenase [Legionella taurinensis]PUT47953.1 glycerate dehydrogenase [Legionella taurinensis]
MNRPEIVILDAKPLINDGLTFEQMHPFGNLTVYDKTAENEIIERARDATIIITNKVRLNNWHFERLPHLRYIGETATGVDNIDVAAAKERGIVVTNVPDYSTDSVAQHVMALLLAYTNGVEVHAQSVARGEWQQHPYFAYWLKPVTELAGMTLGTLGYGKVAQRLAVMAQAFGMRVIAHKPTPFEDKAVRWVNFETLLQQSDVLSLHCPLTSNTRHVINRETLFKMKAGSLLINTGRGGLIDEQALALALKQNHLAAACLDVLTQEPPEANNPLTALPNCLITPHIAWASLAARKRLLNTVCENIIHFLNQKPVNVV